MRPGEIYLAQFPFGDAPGMKLRPVLLLTGLVGPVPEVLVAYISSVIPSQSIPSDLLLDPSQPEFPVHQSEDEVGAAPAQTGDDSLHESGPLPGNRGRSHQGDRGGQAAGPPQLVGLRRRGVYGHAETTYSPVGISGWTIGNI